MKDCPDKKQNLASCDCSYGKNSQLPVCFFPADIEKTYDRSISNFLKINQ